MRTDKISLVGLGKLGLPLLSTFAKNGQKIIGVDVDTTKIEQLSNLEGYLAINYPDYSALIDEISAIHRKRHTEVTRSQNSFHTTAQGNQETYLAGTQATVEAMKSLTRQSVVELNQHFVKIDQLVQSEIDSSYQTIKFSLPE
jgi:UDP-N-acetyl-D-mannosaminuronate dehydrogenase